MYTLLLFVLGRVRKIYFLICLSRTSKPWLDKQSTDELEETRRQVGSGVRVKAGVTLVCVLK